MKRVAGSTPSGPTVIALAALTQWLVCQASNLRMPVRSRRAAREESNKAAARLQLQAENSS